MFPLPFYLYHHSYPYKTRTIQSSIEPPYSPPSNPTPHIPVSEKPRVRRAGVWLSLVVFFRRTREEHVRQPHLSYDVRSGTCTFGRMGLLSSERFATRRP